MTTPRAAAIAGIVFSVLLITSVVIIRLAIPADPRDAGQWLAGDVKPVDLALTLLPFAGIAFLWFMGVIRDRLGEHEDRFFATVFLGSGLLFLAMLFSSAAIAGGIVIAYGASPTALLNSETYAFARAATFVILNTYAVKMAGVFMISTCYTLRPHQSDAALDGVVGLRPGAAPPGEYQSCELGHPGLPAVDPADQRLYPDRKLSQRACSRDRV